MDPNQYPDTESILRGLQSLGLAAEEYSSISTREADKNDIQGSSARKSAQNALVLQAYKFLQVAQGPFVAATETFERTAHLASVRALLEMGVFEKLPISGASRTTAELAHELIVDEALLSRLMRNASVYGPLEETSAGGYKHTPFSKMYLRPEIRGLYRFAMDDHMPAHLKLHEFLRCNNWKEPDSTTNNPYTHAHGTNGRGMFAVLSENPERMKAFNDGMMVQAMTSLWMIDLFPWAEMLAQESTSAETPIAVDIGGGKGRAIARIWNMCGAFECPGRFILQDQPHVVESARPGLPDEIETMPYDFFQEQPVKGALIYLIRRCLHNWPSSSVISILQNTAAAMSSHSRLLLEEIVVPEEGMGIEEGWMDLIMMSLGAKQRTLTEWRDVLGKAGLNIVMVHDLPGDCHALIEVKKIFIVGME